jgi:hypothetical protein
LYLGSTPSFINVLYRMLSPQFMHHHASHVLGCWKGWRWLIKHSGHFQNNGSYYFQSDIIVSAKRLVLPSSEDVSTWSKHGNYTLIRGGVSRFLGWWPGASRDGRCGMGEVLGSSGVNMPSSPFTYSHSSTGRMTHKYCGRLGNSRFQVGWPHIGCGIPVR